MSWEGYYQHICQSGHYFVGAPNYGGFGEEETCPYCKSLAAFTNIVDETNCEAVGEIPMEELQKLKIADAVTETCSRCGHIKVIEPARYRVPSEDERKHMRRWRPGYGGAPLVKLEDPTDL